MPCRHRVRGQLEVAVEPSLEHGLLERGLACRGPARGRPRPAGTAARRSAPCRRSARRAGASSTAARSVPVASSTATRSGLPLERVARAGTIIIAPMSSGPRTVPITKPLVRTRSTYSRRTTAQSLALTRPPSRGRVTVSTKMSCRLGSTISNRRTRSRCGRLPQQRLRVGAVLQAHLDVLAEVGDLRDPGQRGEERAVAVVGEDDGVLAVAGLHLGHGAVEHLLAAVDEGHAVAQPLDRLHLVAGEHDRRAAAAQVEHHLAHDVHAHRVEPAHRLVHDQHVRLVQHGGDELRLLLHALRELVRLLLAPVGEPEPLEPGAEPLLGLLARPSP